jgi:hypothetical protein
MDEVVQVGLLVAFLATGATVHHFLDRDRALIARYVLAAEWVLGAMGAKMQRSPGILVFIVAIMVYGGVGYGAWRWLTRDWEAPPPPWPDSDSDWDSEDDEED